MFGGIALGSTTERARTDTWAFDGTTWTQQHPVHVPPWSNGMAMSFDPKSQSVLMLTLPSAHPGITVTAEGFEAKGPAPFGTWRWTGSDWTELATPNAPLFVTNRTRGAPRPNSAARKRCRPVVLLMGIARE